VTVPRAVALDVLAAIELELLRRDALALPPGLSPEQRAVVRAERVKREFGPASPLWRRCQAFRERLLAGMSQAEFERTMYAVDADKRRRGW
jgi:hypothetical protein